jgi:hypothetical protein
MGSFTSWHVEPASGVSAMVLYAGSSHRFVSAGSWVNGGMAAPAGQQIDAEALAGVLEQQRA